MTDTGGNTADEQYEYPRVNSTQNPSAIHHPYHDQTYSYTETTNAPYGRPRRILPPLNLTLTNKQDTMMMGTMRLQLATTKTTLHIDLLMS